MVNSDRYSGRTGILPIARYISAFRAQNQNIKKPVKCRVSEYNAEFPSTMPVAEFYDPFLSKIYKFCLPHDCQII